jgi:outer membrane cobalamin receptor
MNHPRMSVPWTLLAATAAAAIGCAHAPTAVQADPPEPKSMVVTGSRIQQPVDARTGYPTTTSNVRIYTQEDLDRSGRIQVGPALRQLDPAIGP